MHQQSYARKGAQEYLHHAQDAACKWLN